MKSKKTIIGDRQLHLKGNRNSLARREARMKSFKWEI